MPKLGDLEALAIFVNPYDLEIVIGKERDFNRYAFVIFRGPSDKFSVIIDEKPIFSTPDSALEEIEKILNLALQIGEKQLKDPESLLSQMAKHGDKQIDKSQLLSPLIIKWILDELGKNRIAHTSEM